MVHATGAASARKVVILTFDDVTMSDIGGPADVFALANRYYLPEGSQFYDVVIASVAGGPVRTSSGIVIQTSELSRIEVGADDTLIVAGGGPPQSPPIPEDLVEWLAAHGRNAGRLCAVCTGIFLLAEAGLVDNRRVTTHWEAAPILKIRYPAVIVDAEPIFISDDHVWSSAGFTAGLDLALAMLEQDHGHEVAMRATQAMVLFLRRPGEQPQKSAALSSQLSGDPTFSRLHAWMMQHLSGDLKIEALAEQAGMTPRTFARRYVEKVGRTPAKTVEILRLEAAQRNLVQSDSSLKQIARTCGFGNEQNLRRAFVRSFGKAPELMRQDVYPDALLSRHTDPIELGL